MKYIKNIIWMVLVLPMGIYISPSVISGLAFTGSKPAISEMAPAFSLKDLKGENVRLSDFKGKVVLVNFWASWCPPCKIEIPGFLKVYAAYKDRGFTIIGIALDDVSQSFVKDMGITYPIAIAGDKVVKDYGNVAGIPISFLIGKDGRIIKKVMGFYSVDAVRKDIENALRSRR